MIKLADIITIRPGSGTTADSQAGQQAKFTRSNIELLPVGAATSFSIYHICRARGHKLRQGRIVFHTNDAGTVTQWVDRVTDILAWPGNITFLNLPAIYTVCPEKKETKMFLVISQTKLGRFS